MKVLITQGRYKGLYGTWDDDEGNRGVIILDEPTRNGTQVVLVNNNWFTEIEE